MSRFDSSLPLRGLLSGQDRKPALILLWVPLVLTTWRYFGGKPFYLKRLSSHLVLYADLSRSAELYAFLSSFIALGLVSLAIAKFVLREPVASFGIAIGDWRFGLKALAVMAPVLVALGAVAARSPQFLAEYPLDKGACASASVFLAHAAAYLAYYVGFEIFFRGLVQFGLRERFGDWNAVLVQTALSCLVHIGKPGGEIYGAIVGGLVFGALAFRSRSVIYIILAHFLLGISLDLFICLG